MHLVIHSSAPGKVLICGAYTVLEVEDELEGTSEDFKYSSLVLETSAKFHTFLQFNIIDFDNILDFESNWNTRSKSQPPIDDRKLLQRQSFVQAGWRFTVTFPQFGRESAFQLSLNEDAAEKETLNLIPSSSVVDHPFVYAALVTFLACHFFSSPLYRRKMKSLREESVNGRSVCCICDVQINLMGDAAFYDAAADHQNEQIRQVSFNHSLKQEEFYVFPKFPDAYFEDVGKSGLGSSAALSVSLLSALYSLFYNDDQDTSLCLEKYCSEEHKENVFWLAQISHSWAQGKIGSGFDVASAVYGSSFYRRFPESFLEPLISSLESFKTLDRIVNLDESFKQLVKQKRIIGKFVLPISSIDGEGGFPLDLCVIQNTLASQVGSKTPSLVKSVQHWVRNIASPEERESVWEGLKQANFEFCKFIWNFLRGTSSTIDEPFIYEARRLFTRVRELLRELGQRAHVPIEPPEQTQLIQVIEKENNSSSLVIAGVPGAGGYDAVFALCKPDAASNSANNRRMDLKRKRQSYGRDNGTMSTTSPSPTKDSSPLSITSSYSMSISPSSTTEPSPSTTTVAIPTIPVNSVLAYNTPLIRVPRDLGIVLPISIGWESLTEIKFLRE